MNSESAVAALAEIPALPNVTTEPATTALPAVAIEPATAALLTVAMDPATAALAAVAIEPATAALATVAIEPATAALAAVETEPATDPGSAGANVAGFRSRVTSRARATGPDAAARHPTEVSSPWPGYTTAA